MIDPRRIPVLMLVMSWCALSGACERESPTLVFVVPEGFAGTIKLKGSEPEGTDIPRVDGTLILDVPQDGVIRMTEENPVFEWHRLRARFADGAEIPVLELSGQAGATGFFRLGVRREYVVEETADGFKHTGVPTDETWYYVGERGEAREVARRLRGLDP